MALAIRQAFEAEQAGEVPVGAVVVKDGVVVAVGRNRTIEFNDPSAHAEVIALREAARVLGTHRLPGVELFVTLEPCAMCSGAVFHGRLQRVVFGAHDPKTGCAGSVTNLFSVPELNHHTRVIGGVLANECTALLRDFFGKTRHSKRNGYIPTREDVVRTPIECFSKVEPDSRQSFYFLSSEGFRLHYRDVRANHEREAILCLHDLPFWSRQIDPWISSLQLTNRRLILPDLLGCGLSDKPKKASWHQAKNHAMLLRELLNELGLIPSHVMGIGAGSSVGLELIEAEGWCNTTLIRVLTSEPNKMKTDRSVISTKKVSGRVWTGAHKSLLQGLDNFEQLAVDAPFPDQGHAQVLAGRAHSSFLPIEKNQHGFDVYPLGRGPLFRLPNDCLDAVIELLDRP